MCKDYYYYYYYCSYEKVHEDEDDEKREILWRHAKGRSSGGCSGSVAMCVWMVHSDIKSLWSWNWRREWWWWQSSSLHLPFILWGVEMLCRWMPLLLFSYVGRYGDNIQLNKYRRETRRREKNMKVSAEEKERKKFRVEFKLYIFYDLKCCCFCREEKIRVSWQ